MQPKEPSEAVVGHLERKLIAMPIKSHQHINWHKLSAAIRYYERLGYIYREVPWIVRRSITEVTLPKDAKPFAVEGYGDLCGSAEQSFIQMMVDKEMGLGKWMTLTPCFRDDPIDYHHQKHFMKVELIDTRPEADYIHIMRDAESFMLQYVQDRAQIQNEKISDNQIDLMLDAEWLDDLVEIGSYGVRTFTLDGVTYTWHYGTGLAEPRFSSLI
jgi:hypothetical protein